MSDGSYLSRLSKNELKNTIDSAYTHLNDGIDLASNKESLFNYMKSLDTYLSLPHKSIVNESFIYKNIKDKSNLFLAERTQDFRVHTLDILEHNKFEIIYRYFGIIEPDDLEYFRDNYSIEINVNNINMVAINNLNDENKKNILVNDYNKETKEYNLYIHEEIILVDEFTPINIISKKVETIDNSLAIANSYATYTSHYDITLPENFIIKQIFHNDTLASNGKAKQVTSNKNDNHANININGWQLPGLSFVLTYEKN